VSGRGIDWSRAFDRRALRERDGRRCADKKQAGKEKEACMPSGTMTPGSGHSAA
jgi:hypothetical protein